MHLLTHLMALEYTIRIYHYALVYCTCRWDRHSRCSALEAVGDILIVGTIDMFGGATGAHSDLLLRMGWQKECKYTLCQQQYGIARRNYLRRSTAGARVSINVLLASKHVRTSADRHTGIDTNTQLSK